MPQLLALTFRIIVTSRDARAGATMSARILITGGAGFIGSHLADELLEKGCHVRVFDCLAAQVHGSTRERPQYLDPEVELVSGDIRDPAAVRHALEGMDAVFHFAAMVGVGQSMYQVAEYTSVNNQGTAVLLQELIERPVEKLAVASSMSLYGEGLYRTAEGDLVEGTERTLAQLKSHQCELRDEHGDILTPVPTPE